VNRIGIIQEGRTEHAGDVDHDPKRYQDAEEDSLRMLFEIVLRCCMRGLRVYGPGRKRIHRQAEIIRERYASQEIGSVAAEAVVFVAEGMLRAWRIFCAKVLRVKGFWRNRDSVSQIPWCRRVGFAYPEI